MGLGFREYFSHKIDLFVGFIPDLIKKEILNINHEDDFESFYVNLERGNELCKDRILPMSHQHILKVKYIYKSCLLMKTSTIFGEKHLPMIAAANAGYADIVWGFIEYAKQTNTDLHTDKNGGPHDFMWIKDEWGKTALGEAVSRNRVEVINVLLSNARMTDLESEWDSIGKDSLLPVLLDDPKYDDFIIRMLQKEKVKQQISAPTSTPSMTINIPQPEQTEAIVHTESIKNRNAYTWSERNETRNYINELDGLLGMNPNTSTILHLESKSGEASRVEEILEKDYSLIYHRNSEGETAAFVAAREGHVHILNVMINKFKRRSDIGIESLVALFTRHKDKHSALHIAILNHRVEVIFWLIEEIPQLANHINDVGESPLYLAAERQYCDIIYHILENCKEPAFEGPQGKTALHAAAISNSGECIKYLLDRKPDLFNEADGRGWTPLQYAVHHNSSLATTQLLNANPTVGYYLMNQDGVLTSAIHIAASRGHYETMEVLIDKCRGCSEFIDEKGRNILHVAIESMKTEVIEFIFQDTSLTSLINQRDINGNTPAHLLVTSNYKMMEMVIDSRIDINARNNEHQTPLDMISSSEKRERLIKAIAMGKNIANKRGTTLISKESKSNSYEKASKAKDKSWEERFTMVDNLVIVAALIATATFAAGFTMPGGFDSDSGSKLGTPYLLKKSAFQAFVVTNAIAFSCSSSVLLVHIALLIYRNRYDEVHWGQQKYINRRIIVIYFLTGIAMVAMLLAFVTGLYVVLTPSLWLAIFVCAITFFVVVISWKA